MTCCVNIWLAFSWLGVPIECRPVSNVFSTSLCLATWKVQYYNPVIQVLAVVPRAGTFRRGTRDFRKGSVPTSSPLLNPSWADVAHACKSAQSYARVHAFRTCDEPSGGGTCTWGNNLGTYAVRLQCSAVDVFRIVTNVGLVEALGK